MKRVKQETTDLTINKSAHSVKSPSKLSSKHSDRKRSPDEGQVMSQMQRLKVSPTPKTESAAIEVD